MADPAAFTPISGDALQVDGNIEEVSLGRLHAPSHTSGFIKEPDSCCQFSKHVCKQHSAIRVKNTFIQAFAVDEAGDEEDELPMLAVKSCPVVRATSTCPTSVPADDSSSNESPAPSPRVDQQVAPCEMKVGQKVPSSQVVPLEMRMPEMSVGSALHWVGGCKPCYWFWRAQGCINGSECRHCHLCLRGAKGLPQLVAGHQGAEQQAAAFHGEVPQLPLAPHIDSLSLRAPEISVGSALHVSGQCKPCSWFWRPHGCVNGAACRYCHLCSDRDSDAKEIEAKTRMRAIVPPTLRVPEHSVGSALHESGQCKPCSWFWRPQGCVNGIECRHCHLCSDRDIKARRRTRAMKARRALGNTRAAIPRMPVGLQENQPGFTVLKGVA